MSLDKYCDNAFQFSKVIKQNIVASFITGGTWKRRFWWRHDYVITTQWCDNIRSKFSIS